MGDIEQTVSRETGMACPVVTVLDKQASRARSLGVVARELPVRAMEKDPVGQIVVGS
jgi:hypothetical protein